MKLHKSPSKISLNTLRELVNQDLLGHLEAAPDDAIANIGAGLDEDVEALEKMRGEGFSDDAVGLSAFSTGMLREISADDRSLAKDHQRHLERVSAPPSASGDTYRAGQDAVADDLACARALKENPKRIFSMALLERLHSLVVMADPKNSFPKEDRAIAWEILLRYLGALLPVTGSPDPHSIAESADVPFTQQFDEDRVVPAKDGMFTRRMPTRESADAVRQKIILDASALWKEISDLGPKRRWANMKDIAAKYGVPATRRLVLEEARTLGRIENLLYEIRVGVVGKSVANRRSKLKKP